MVELIGLLLLLIGLLIWISYDPMEWYTSPQEGFTGNSDQVTLSACPSEMNTFYLSDGRTACCNGSVTGSRCTGSVQCTMTGDGTKELPNCADLVKKDFNEKSSAHCPPSMTSYFENKSEKKKGCTSGGLDSEMKEPATKTQPVCWIYPTLDENLRKVDSCELQKQLEEAPCFGVECKKSITPSTPPLIAIQFIDKSGMYRTAYTKKSLEYFLNDTRPKWKDEGLDLEKNVMVADVAKAFFVDKTLSQKDVQM